MRIWLWLLAACTHAAFAFPTDQHYRLATESADLALDWQDHWDPESSSDYVTYQRPITWDVSYWRNDRVFDLTAGSISSKQFLHYQRLKLYHNLTERVQFRLHWLEERDFEQDRRAVPVELKFRLSERIALSAIGQTSLYKAENDVGVSLFVFPKPDWELRISTLWGDFQRNQRNLDTDRWSRSPVAWTGSIARTPADRPGDLFRLEGHYERPSLREDGGRPTARLAYHSIYTLGSYTLPSTRVVRWRALFDNAEYEDLTAIRARSRKRSLNQVEYQFRMGPHVVRPGLNLFYREGRDNGDQMIYREILPTVWMELLPRTRSWGTGLPSIGYDATVFEEHHDQHDDRNLEHRLNTKYEMLFNGGGRLGFLFTFDLDRFGSGETWEGGAAQFRLDY